MVGRSQRHARATVTDVSSGGRRRGISREQNAELKELHRDVVMIRAGAALFTDNGKRQWHGICEWCRAQGKAEPKWLQVAHVEPVGGAPHLRYDPENARALCARCHIFTWHKAPRRAEAWITAVMGVAARRALALRADSKGFRPDFHLTRLHLIACRVKLNQRTRGGRDD